MNALAKILFSTRFTAFLFITFATAMAAGTFVESRYSTETARIWIYNARWFEAIMLLFALNFCGNIARYRLYRREKWAVLLLHLSFILILLGAFITRYFGYEGIMPIREGETANTFLSEKTYLTVWVDGDLNGQPRRKTLQDAVMITPEAKDASLPWQSDFNGKPFTIAYAGFIKGAEEAFVTDPSGEPYLKLVEASDGARHDHYLKNGEVANIHNLLFALNKPTPGAINLTVTDSLLTLQSPFEGTFMQMADRFAGSVPKDSLQPLRLRTLYTLAGVQFVFPETPVKGRFDLVKATGDEAPAEDALLVDVTTRKETRRVKLLGAKGAWNEPKRIHLGGLDFSLSYGSIRRELPFSLTLRDFIAEKYPGTEKSYASYTSKITVNDGKPFPFDIYMNHILDHRGYRFFQASFQPDEKGTILSVNHDFWGTWISYTGYFLLYLGLMGILFYGKTRFKALSRQLRELKTPRAALIFLAIFFAALQGFSQSVAPEPNPHRPGYTPRQADSILRATAIPAKKAAAFGRLVMQDDGGRMKPINTFASELLRKMSKRDTYAGLDANQALLSMMQRPALWYQAECIYLKRGNDSLRKIIGLPKGKKYARVIDFIDALGNYKLGPYLEAAYTARTPNQFQKDFKDIDHRLGLLNRALGGEILKIFPVPNDANRKWVSYPERADYPFTGADSLYVERILPLYLQALNPTQPDYANATALLESMKGFQEKYGSAVLPSEKRIEAEIRYNRYDIFKRLFSWYLYAGTLLFTLIIFQIFKENRVVRVLVKTLVVVVAGLFVLHTLGLGARWYVSGHAPWSDAYESMIYVAWAAMGMGLLFARKSALTVAATAFVTSIILMIAHWNWMDPAIGNLQPVLNSYWLMIHVAVIVASYGPFTLGMILGVTALLLILFTTARNRERMEAKLKEITIINELALTVGLVMLAIGNFLGGQWANESWGRYWGWDPKETWALISIMVYAFVIHARLVPGLRGRWFFNLMSILAFASIMMTYFGVNFYLTGLHSYASGDKIITPGFVYYALAGVALLGALSYWKYRIHFKENG